MMCSRASLSFSTHFARARASDSDPILQQPTNTCVDVGGTSQLAARRYVSGVSRASVGIIDWDALRDRLGEELARGTFERKARRILAWLEGDRLATAVRRHWRLRWTMRGAPPQHLVSLVSTIERACALSSRAGRSWGDRGHGVEIVHSADLRRAGMKRRPGCPCRRQNSDHAARAHPRTRWAI